MIKVIPFKPEHAFGIDPLIASAEMQNACKNKTYVKMLYDLGPAYTGLDKEGKTVGIAGIRPINDTTWEGWAILDKTAPKYIKSIVRAVNLFIDTQFECNTANRIQATVRLDFKQGHRFAKLLGFHPEGILRNYNQGYDFMMYARINTWL